MLDVTITTAVKLDTATATKIKKAVEKKHSQSVKLSQVVDPEVLGGIKLTFGSHQLDATLSSRFDQIKAQLLSIA